jgi:hypothetical protein
MADQIMSESFQALNFDSSSVKLIFTRSSSHEFAIALIGDHPNIDAG